MRTQLLMFAAAAALAAQTEPARPLPKGHPEVESKGRRQEASRLTEQVAGSREGTGPVARVARKNFVDEHIFGKIERDGIPHAGIASDEEFFRRIHLDLTGRLPQPAALHEFLASTDAQKRDKLIDSLMSTDAYKSRWTYWFGDLAMTSSNRVGNDGKNIFYRWIYDNLHLNRPYNEMVQEMITANALSNWYVGPASYIARWIVIGLSCDDVVHEDTADDLAIQTARDFLGLNLQCVSCHDGKGHTGKINLWLTERKRGELWQEAAFFAKTKYVRRTEIAVTQDEYRIEDGGPGYNGAARSVERIPRQGKGPVEPAFILTGEKPDPTRPLRPQLARMITSHPQFARAAVNMFWAELMGVGLVDPVYDFDLLRQDPKAALPAGWTVQPSHPELLDALANDFREHNYDLQRLFKLITKSNAYQLSSKFPGEWKDAYAKYYARKFVRRLKAEEIYDSIVSATGLYTKVPIRGTDFEARYATELRSPEDFKQRMPGFKDINFFLESFGQNNREYKERTNDGDITQAVLLMNSPFVKNQVKASPQSNLGKALASGKADAAIIAETFERFLTRRPTQEESAFARDLIGGNRQRGFEDLQWLLMNKVEFLFNY